jgi:hypothetical protein
LDGALLAFDNPVELFTKLIDAGCGIQVSIWLLRESRDVCIDFDDPADLDQQEIVVCFHLQHLIIIRSKYLVELCILFEQIKSLLLALHSLLEVLGLKLVLELEFFKIDGKLPTHTVYLRSQAFYVCVFLVDLEPSLIFNPDC